MGTFFAPTNCLYNSQDMESFKVLTECFIVKPIEQTICSQQSGNVHLTNFAIVLGTLTILTLFVDISKILTDCFPGAFTILTDCFSGHFPYSPTVFWSHWDKQFDNNSQGMGICKTPQLFPGHFQYSPTVSWSLLGQTI
jgi:hypothetical protein